jgi:hypothetical protein
MQRDALLAVDRVRATAGAAAAGWSAAVWQASWPHRCLYGQQVRWRGRTPEAGHGRTRGPATSVAKGGTAPAPPCRARICARAAATSAARARTDRAAALPRSATWPHSSRFARTTPTSPPTTYLDHSASPGSISLACTADHPPSHASDQPHQEWSWCTVAGRFGRPAWLQGVTSGIGTPGACGLVQPHRHAEGKADGALGPYSGIAPTDIRPSITSGIVTGAPPESPGAFEP